ncbi:MAG: hypothetical protein JRC86_03055, partial [Deltaproteobacteria bacterium]|nr:hypothetical protein [Deltaproteobacteria bacterium]
MTIAVLILVSCGSGCLSNSSENENSPQEAISKLQATANSQIIHSTGVADTVMESAGKLKESSNGRTVYSILTAEPAGIEEAKSCGFLDGIMDKFNEWWAGLFGEKTFDAKTDSLYSMALNTSADTLSGNSIDIIYAETATQK